MSNEENKKQEDLTELIEEHLDDVSGGGHASRFVSGIQNLADEPGKTED